MQFVLLGPVQQKCEINANKQRDIGNKEREGKSSGQERKKDKKMTKM